MMASIASLWPSMEKLKDEGLESALIPLLQSKTMAIGLYLAPASLSSSSSFGSSLSLVFLPCPEAVEGCLVLSKLVGTGESKREGDMAQKEGERAFEPPCFVLK